MPNHKTLSPARRANSSRLALPLLLTLPLLLIAAGAAPAQETRGDTAFSGLGSRSQEPIRIDADRLDVFDRENKAIYAGNVVAVQGDTTMQCSVLTIFFERSPGQVGAQESAGSQQNAQQGGEGDSINRIECDGPVTILSQDQVATGNRAIYDRVGGQIILSGDVALSQGPNVTRGERLVYDVDRGVANVEAGGNQRVRGLFVPGSSQGAAPR